MEDSRGKDPALEAQIRDAVINKKALVKVDLNVGALIRNGKVRQRLHPFACELVGIAMAAMIEIRLAKMRVKCVHLFQVRDVYDSGDFIISVTSDRQSAFDRMLCAVPFKGQVLNQTSVWWFENTQHIIPNAFVASPHPYVTVMKKAKVGIGRTSLLLVQLHCGCAALQLVHPFTRRGNALEVFDRNISDHRCFKLSLSCAAT